MQKHNQANYVISMQEHYLFFTLPLLSLQYSCFFSSESITEKAPCHKKENTLQSPNKAAPEQFEWIQIGLALKIQQDKQLSQTEGR